MYLAWVLVSTVNAVLRGCNLAWVITLQCMHFRIDLSIVWPERYMYASIRFCFTFSVIRTVAQPI